MADLTRYNVLLALFISVGTFSWGFGFAVYNTSIGQPGFYSYFELDPTSACEFELHHHPRSDIKTFPGD